MSKSTVCGFVALAMIVISGLVGYALSLLPAVVAVIAIVLFTAFSLFMGMVLASIRHHELAAEKVHDEEEVIANLHQSAMRLLAAQKRTYGEVSKAQSNIVSNRVGIRIVEEMLHGLENEEQKDAAYRQVGAIIADELEKINEEVWGEKTCPKDTSKG